MPAVPAALRRNLSSTGIRGQLPEFPPLLIIASSLAALDLSNTQVCASAVQTSKQQPPVGWPPLAGCTSCPVPELYELAAARYFPCVG